MGSLSTAAITLALVGVAIWAGRIAVSALRQTTLDSISQTRPYVYAHLVPSIAGIGSWDLTIKNSGQFSAKEMSMSCSEWPDYDDLFTQRFRVMFNSEQTIPSGVSIRTLWRAVAFSDHTVTVGSPMMGMHESCSISAKYRGDHPKDLYSDTYSFSNETRGRTPMPAGGTEPSSSLNPGEKSLHKMLSRVAQSIGELGQ
ncbi:hypothetical protein ACX80D_09605 [Arthrobacter sp. Sr24]